MDKVAVAKVAIAKSTKIWHFLLSHFLPCPFLPLNFFILTPVLKVEIVAGGKIGLPPPPPNNNNIDSDQILMSCVHYWHIVYLYFADLRIVNGPL